MNRLDIIILIYFSLLVIIVFALLIIPRWDTKKIFRFLDRKTINIKNDFIENNFTPLALGKLIIYPDFVYQVPKTFVFKGIRYSNLRSSSFINNEGILVGELNNDGKIVDWKRLTKNDFFEVVENYKKQRDLFDKEIIPTYTFEIDSRKFKYQKNKDKTYFVLNVKYEDDLEKLREAVDEVNYDIIPIKNGSEAVNGILVNRYKGVKLQPKSNNDHEPLIDTSNSEYYYKGKRIKRNEAISIIDLSYSPNDLTDLSFTHDKTLSDLIYKKYPSLNPQKN